MARTGSPDAPATALTSRTRRRWLPARTAFSVRLYGGFVAGANVLGLFSLAYLPRLGPPALFVSAHHPLVRVWAHWDAGWYAAIARWGYNYKPGAQSAVAFFPVYPGLMRVGSRLTGLDPATVGVLVTLVAGATAAVAFTEWCHDRLPERSARTAITVLLCYPFALYLLGAVYADAVFLAAAVASFVLVDRERLWLGAFVGAVASATRPLGLIVAIGLVLRVLERRRLPSRLAPLIRGRGKHVRRTSEGLPSLRWRDGAVVLSVLGVIGYSTLLWYRFGQPLAWLSVQRAWDQAPGLHTWLKYDAFKSVLHSTGAVYRVAIVVQGLIALAALGLVPTVYRRFGWAYGTYTALLIVTATLGSHDFVGIGRYLLAAFPCFAVLGDTLVDRPRTKALGLGLGALGLGTATALFAVGSYFA